MKGLTEVLRHPRALLLPFAGWLALLGLAWWWLNLPEAAPADLALSAIVMLAAFALLGALASRAFGRRLREILPWLALWLILTALLLVFIPQRNWAAISAFLLIAFVAPLLAGGARGVVLYARLAYWAEFAWFCQFSLLYPWLLIRWTPAFTSLEAQTASAVLRFGLALLSCVIGWCVLGSGTQECLRQIRGQTAVEPAQHQAPPVTPD